MKQKIQLQVPEPCHEDWNNMSATQQGRFCMSCQKEVVDFSVMTDKEIIAHIADSTHKMCGRFCGDQLNRELIVPAEPRKTWWKYWMSIAASLVMLMTKSNAQVKFVKDSVVAVPPRINYTQDVEVIAGFVSAKGRDYYKKNYTVTGIIKDENNNPVFGATVMIKDTKMGVASDFNGAFTIRINDAKNVVLRVSYVGYEMQDVKVDNSNAQSLVNVNVKLIQMVQGLMGDVVITSVRRKKNLFNYFKKDSIKTETPPVKQSLAVYPNPVIKGTVIKLNIDNLQEGNYQLAVYDVMGNPVATKEIKVTGSNVKESLACDHRFAGGVYVISLTGYGKIISSKIIVQ